MNRRRATTILVLLLSIVPILAAGGATAIKPDELKDWLTYISSDELQGRGIYTEGLGLAAGYIQRHLEQWGVKPAGDPGKYLQTVKVQGVRTTSRSSVVVQVGNETRTFKDGDGVTFPKNAGAKRTLTLDRVEFEGYGLDAPGANHVDFKGKDVRGAAVIFLGSTGPKSADAQTYRRLLNGRSRYAIDQMRAAATVGPAPTPAANRPARAANAPDFTTTQRLDLNVPPAVTADDAFFEFLFSKAPIRYAELHRRADQQEELPAFRLENVKLTFQVDADYKITRTQLTDNVVGIIDGSDP